MTSGTEAIDALEAALLPEIFILVGDVLLRRKTKKTLLNLMLACKSIHGLFLPIFMRTIEVFEATGFSPGRFAAFAMDGLGSGKFSHVKTLRFDTSIVWGDKVPLFKGDGKVGRQHRGPGRGMPSLRGIGGLDADGIGLVFFARKATSTKRASFSHQH
jgi:hypothetical protein